MWLPEQGEPWPPPGESPWQFAFIELEAVPRQGDYIRHDGHGWEVGTVVWEQGKPVELRARKDRA
jgi:hypothetical protein